MLNCATARRFFGVRTESLEYTIPDICTIVLMSALSNGSAS